METKLISVIGGPGNVRGVCGHLNTSDYCAVQERGSVRLKWKNIAQNPAHSA